jgi:glutathione S-transferase
MILVGQYDSPYVRRVAISLHLLGIPFQRDPRSVFADADAMRGINPLGRIPSLILDDGEVLIDSAAILDHLDEQVGAGRALLPARGPDRRRALKIVVMATGAIDKVGACVYERLLRPPERIYQPWIDRCATQLASALDALEATTPVGGWVLGGAGPTQADVTVGCMIGHLHLRMADVLPANTFTAEHHPRMTRLSGDLEGLPAFRATRASEDETMPGPLPAA